MGFFQKFYYGKAGQADFNPEDLPKNRRELFFAMLRIRFSGICGQNLISVLFKLPIICVLGYALMFILSLGQAMQEDATLIESFSRDWFSLAVMMLAILVPCHVISGIGTTGTRYILRNWARDQHAFGFSDIKDSIKTNWKQGALFGLLTGIIDLVCFVGWYFYRNQASLSASPVSAILMTVLEGFMIIFPIVWWMIGMAAYPMMITYNMKLRVVIRNCLILIIGKLPLSVGIWLLTMVPTILCAVLFLLLGSGWPLLAWVLIYLVCGFGLTGFLYASYSNYLFDQYLNPRIEGAPVNMGLRSDEFNDDDADDDVSDFNPQPGYRPTPAPNGNEAWPPRRDDSWLDAAAERNLPTEEEKKSEDK